MIAVRVYDWAQPFNDLHLIAHKVADACTVYSIQINVPIPGIRQVIFYQDVKLKITTVSHLNAKMSANAIVDIGTTSYVENNVFVAENVNVGH